MEIRWGVDDGYGGKSRSYITEIPDDEFDACMSKIERENLIYEYIQEDFDQNIGWYIIDEL